jgi:hypothetical protein
MENSDVDRTSESQPQVTRHCLPPLSPQTPATFLHLHTMAGLDVIWTRDDGRN